MIKLIASDMDGTLLNSKSKISKQDLTAIELAQQNHIKFIVVTGRYLSEATPFFQNFKQKPDFITLNGALVYNQQLKPIIQVPLEQKELRSSINILQQHHLYYEIVTTNGIYSTSRTQRIQNTASFLQKLNPTLNYKKALNSAITHNKLTNINYISSFDSILNQSNEPIMKILSFQNENNTEFEKAKSLLQKLSGIVITSSSPNNLEINSQKAQKGIAVKTFANAHNISMNQVMAIGDNFNDVSMIEAAGLGVAMGNAIPPLKKLAQYQTADNSNSGVAQAINYAIQINRREKT